MSFLSSLEIVKGFGCDSCVNLCVPFTYLRYKILSVSSLVAMLMISKRIYRTH